MRLLNIKQAFQGAAAKDVSEIKIFVRMFETLVEEEFFKKMINSIYP